MSRKTRMRSAARLRPDVSWVRDDGAPGFLFAARTGGVFALNRTGAAIVEGIERGLGREDLVATLVKSWRTDDLEAGQAVDGFLSSLRENDLVAD